MKQWSKRNFEAYISIAVKACMQLVGDIDGSLPILISKRRASDAMFEPLEAGFVAETDTEGQEP